MDFVAAQPELSDDGDAITGVHGDETSRDSRAALLNGFFRCPGRVHKLKIGRPYVAEGPVYTPGFHQVRRVLGPQLLGWLSGCSVRLAVRVLLVVAGLLATCGVRAPKQYDGDVLKGPLADLRP